jgi:acyl-CoA oxidase
MCPKTELPTRTDVESLDVQLELLRAREIYLLGELTENMTAKFGSGIPLFDVWMKEESNTIQNLAKAYGERIAIESVARTIDTCPASCKPVFGIIAKVFGLDVIMSDARFFMTRGLISLETGQAVEGKLNAAVKELAPSALRIVESFGIPEHGVRVPIAKDYERFQ